MQMRIVEEYTDTNADLIEVKSANYIGDFAISPYVCNWALAKVA